jgi:hypothetical protein
MIYDKNVCRPKIFANHIDKYLYDIGKDDVLCVLAEEDTIAGLFSYLHSLILLI